MVTSLSLFSGAGGLDLGLDIAGIKAKAYVDKDKNCRSTIFKNYQNAIVHDDVFNKDVFKYKNIDIVVGGPPCQSFSTIGNRKFLDDSRGQAMLGFVEVVKIIKPQIFLMENVQGIVSAKGVLEHLIYLFSKMGYIIDWKILNASDFEVPQIRKRFVMVGSKNKKIELANLQTSTKTIILKDVIKDLENKPGECAVFSKSMLEFMKKIPEGGNWKNLNSEDQDRAMGKANRQSGGLTAFYRRLDYNKQSPTLLTSATQRATTLCHPVKNRPLSIMEYKRIQCFPDNWIVDGSPIDKYRQLGNAVPVLMGKAIGKLIMESIAS